ncbi:MAG: carbon-nitrogen hydrolase family protein [Spirochaetales bacterium]|nr:carbon-nitrogen hydrolase family protein [Spirochaetales bacterium]
MKLTVCAAQMEIETRNVEKNLAKAQAFAREATEGEGCHFLCYPELFLTGALGRADRELFQTVPGPFTDIFCDMAARYGIHIVMGSITEIDGDRIYNTSVLIDDRGSIIGSYRKMNLWCGEKLFNTPGNTPGVFDTRWGKVGIQICWDIAFPEVSRSIAAAGARVIFCPTLWTHDDRYSYINGMKEAEQLRRRIPDVDTEEIFIHTCVAARAIENCSAVILVNGCGKTDILNQTHTLVGHTQVGLPFYGRWKFLAAEERLLTVEIDTELLDLAETAYHIFEDLGR